MGEQQHWYPNNPDGLGVDAPGHAEAVPEPVWGPEDVPVPEGGIPVELDERGLITVPTLERAAASGRIPPCFECHQQVYPRRGGPAREQLHATWMVEAWLKEGQPAKFHPQYFPQGRPWLCRPCYAKVYGLGFGG